MLSMNSLEDRDKMMKYYRTSDMLNLLYFFPELSPIRDLTIVEDEEDYLRNKEFLETLAESRVDTLKGRPFISGIENSGGNHTFYNELLSIKDKDPYGVLVLFNTNITSSKRYERLAGISLVVNVGENVIIEAVSKGFDGREVSKGICVHERYLVPWYDLRKITNHNLKEYLIYKISDNDYQITRNERIKFLKSVGFEEKVFSSFIPEKYQPIPDSVWASVVKNVLKKLEDNEDILTSCCFINFAISGHTEGTSFTPWQMFDKTRYTSLKK